MKVFTARGIHGGLLLAGTSLLSVAAAAQTTSSVGSLVVTQADAADSEAPNGAATGDIIVTAQRRSETLQKVPMTVTVATGEQLQKLALTDFKDVQQLSPGLEISNNDGRSNVATIRGISFEPDSGTSPAVDIYFNDIPVDAQTVFGAIYDVGQIEVLRGPQGIFRGRTSPAGAITLTTRRADLQSPEGYAQANGTNRDGLNIQGGASVPLVPGKLAMRFSALYDFNRGGQIVSIDGRKSKSQTMSGRLSFAFAPSENFRANLMYQYFWSDASPNYAVFGPGNAPFAAFGDPTRTGPALTLKDRTSVDRTMPRFTNQTHLVTLDAEWDISDYLNLSVDAGYQDTKQAQHYPKAGIEAAVPGLIQSNELSFIPKTITIDARLSSNSDGPFNWMFGADYQTFRADPTIFSGSNDFLLASPTAPFPLSPNLFGSGLPNPVRASTNVSIPVTRNTKAIFGTIRYQIAEALRFEAGLRYTKYHVNQQSFLTFCIETFGTCPRTNQPAFSPDLQKRDNNALTGGATLSYDITPDLTTYLAYGRSYRAPYGQNAAALGGTTNPDLLLSKPEKSDAYEVGIKGKVLDNRLSFALTAFYQKYQDYVAYLPALATRAATGGFTFIPTSTSGDATSKGVELQITSRFSRNLDLGISASYVDARFDNAVTACTTFDASGAVTIPVGQEFATCSRNDRLAQVPKFTFNTNGEYRFSVGSVTPFIRGLANYRPSFQSELDNFKYRAYTNLSAFIGVRGPDDRWELSAFVKNALNQARALRVSAGQLQANTVLFNFATPGAPALSGYRSAAITPPREFGLTARFKW